MKLDEFVAKIDAQFPWVQWADVSVPVRTHRVSLRGRATAGDLAYTQGHSEELFDLLAARERERRERQTAGITS